MTGPGQNRKTASIISFFTLAALAVEYLDEHDTLQGYTHRCEEIGCSAKFFPAARLIAITGPRDNGTLHAPENREHMRCPGQNCPYVARQDLANPWEAMRDHLQQRHEIICTETKKYTYGTPEDLVEIAKGRDWILATPAKYAPIMVRGIPNREDEQMEVIQTFCYLGSILCDDESMDPEILTRIAKATKAFFSFPNKFWKNERIPVTTRIQIFEACIVPILTYAAETWVLTTSQESRITATYLMFLRYILCMHNSTYDFQPEAPFVITRYFVTTNEAVLQKANVRAMGDILRQKRLRQLGTTIRRNPESFTSKSAQIVGIPSHRGPEVRSWLQVVSDDMYALGVTPALALNPTAWKTATTACRRGDT